MDGVMAILLSWHFNFLCFVVCVSAIIIIIMIIILLTEFEIYPPKDTTFLYSEQEKT